MTLRRLPPLHTLEAFEAAARSLSFKQAGAELHLTASAISHRIKALEAFVGFALFARGNRSLELTDGGRAYRAVVDEALSRLRDGGDRVARRHARARLAISMGPFIANEIVLPALASFQMAHPDIDVRIDTGLRPLDLQREDVDIALRFGSGHWPQLAAQRLMQTEAVPVCAPALARRLEAGTIADLGGVALIHSSPMPQGWRDWAHGVGLEPGNAGNDVWLDSYLAILRAAEQGLGLALGLMPMVAPWVQAQRLAMPWPQLRYPVPQGYYLLHRRGDDREQVRAFGDWLRTLLARQATA